MNSLEPYSLVLGIILGCSFCVLTVEFLRRYNACQKKKKELEDMKGRNR